MRECVSVRGRERNKNMGVEREEDREGGRERVCDSVRGIERGRE
jgi:hypothetical protein